MHLHCLARKFVKVHFLVLLLHFAALKSAFPFGYIKCNAQSTISSIESLGGIEKNVALLKVTFQGLQTFCSRSYF